MRLLCRSEPTRHFIAIKCSKQRCGDQKSLPMRCFLAAGCLLRARVLRYITRVAVFMENRRVEGPVYCPERPSEGAASGIGRPGSEQERISTMSDIEAKIRAKARELWQAEGQPEGRAEQHWLEAEALVRAEAEAKPKAARKPRAAAAKKEPAEAKEPAAKKPAAKKETAKKEPAKKPALKVVSG